MDLTGKVIGGCRVDRLVGGGAMGAVYQGLHLGLQKPVAIKIMSERLAGDQQYIQRFLTEARLAAQIEHPNIVQVLNVGAAGPLHYIVMQYVEGESVAARMARDGPLPPQEAARIALGIARGLAAAHAKNIIHRDIKPANVLLTREGEPKVADLGLAKAVTTDLDSQLTAVGETMGTPQYMPPEQAADARSADPRSDIYALGATIYHMLIGEAPFVAPTAFAVIQKHLSEPAPEAIAKRAEIPQAFSDLILKMMAKKREDRPQSMAEVVAALEQICGMGAARAPAQRAKPWLPLAVGAGAAVLLLVLWALLRPSPGQVAFEGALAHWKSHPNTYEGALDDFAKVSRQFPGTKWAGKADEAAEAVKAVREKAADEAFERTARAAQAAGAAHDYDKALLAWDEFPKDLRVGECAEKVRTARSKARLPVRVAGFMKAIDNQEPVGALQYLEPEQLNAQGRDITLGILKLMRGVGSLFFDLEGWEIKNIEFSPDMKSANVAVSRKLVNKGNKQRETKDEVQIWEVYKDDWYRRLKPPGPRPDGPRDGKGPPRPPAP